MTLRIGWPTCNGWTSKQNVDNPTRMSVRVGLAVAFACAVGSLLVFVNTVNADEDPWFSRDKRLHFGVSTAISASAYGVSALWIERPVLRAVSGFSFALSLGLAKEGWDALGHGHASLRDGTWDVLGSLTGVAIAWAVDRGLARLRKQRWRGQPLGFRMRRLQLVSDPRRWSEAPSVLVGLPSDSS